MSEEEKAKPEAEEVKTDEVETKDDETATQDEAESEQVDYKAELEREKKAREDAEKAAADLAFKLREEKRKKEDEGEEEKPLTAAELQSILANERQATRKEMLASEADRIASDLTGSAEEKALVLEIHKNRTFPAHLSLNEQIEEAYVIANRKKILGENNELKRALKGKNGVSHNVSSYQDEMTGTQPKLSAGDAQVLAQTGFKWNPTSKRFEKKMANGQILARDNKTKQTFLIK